MQVFIYIFLALVLFALLSYYLLFSTLLSKSFQVVSSNENHGISIVICAKNEAENLSKNVPYFLKQEYKEYEVVVVNDASEDETARVLEKFSKENSFLKIVTIDNKMYNNLKGKRQALFEGVQQAKYPYVLLSDADCKPSSAFWVKQMAAKLFEGIDVVLGFSPYENEKNKVAHLVQYETSLVAMQYGLMTLLGLPYMGVGRNVLIRKEVLNETVFQQSNKSLGGDDDLILGQIMNGTNTLLQFDRSAWVNSKAPQTLAAWFKQKKRHYNSGKQYAFKNMVLASFYPLVKVIFIALILSLLTFKASVTLVLALYFIEQLALHICLRYVNGGQTKMIASYFLAPFFDLIFWILFIILHLQSLKTRNVWK